MKVFTVDDYFELGDDHRKLVDAWLKKYQLQDSSVCLITGQKSLTEDQAEGTLYEDDHVAVYSDMPVTRWIDPENYILTANKDISFNSFTKIAEFQFNDFPWEV